MNENEKRREQSLRAQLIERGLIRPYDGELTPVQLPPGTRVFRLEAPPCSS